MAKNGTQTKGFRLPRKTALLTFEGDYDGAEVEVNLSTTLGEFLSFQELVGPGVNPDGEVMLRAFRLFGEKQLIGWNLQNDQGGPLPIGPDALLELPPEFVNLVLNSWMKAVTQISSPLAEASGDLSMLAALSKAQANP